jgi:hypothetical protein
MVHTLSCVLAQKTRTAGVGENQAHRLLASVGLEIEECKVGALRQNGTSASSQTMIGISRDADDRTAAGRRNAAWFRPFHVLAQKDRGGRWVGEKSAPREEFTCHLPFAAFGKNPVALSKIGGGHLENRVGLEMARGDSRKPADSFCSSGATGGAKASFFGAVLACVSRGD